MDFAVLAAECAPLVAPETMAAIVKTESQFKPFAININGGARLERQPSNKDEAVATAKWLLNNNYNIDMGLGQVNSANLKKVNLTVDDAFDPCKNLAASATILQWNYESASRIISDQQSALQAAISAYNTGSFVRGFSNGYVQKVINNAKEPGADNKIVIRPIKLVAVQKKVNSDKSPQLKQPSAMAALFESDDSGAGLATSVYEKESISNQEVMVYR